MHLLQLPIIAVLLAVCSLARALPSPVASPEQQARDVLLSLRAQLMQFQKPLHTTLLMAPQAALPTAGAEAETESQTQSSEGSELGPATGDSAEEREAKDAMRRKRAGEVLNTINSRRWADPDLEEWE